jgi:hypothetical protein
MIYGYERVSAVAQDETGQVRQLILFTSLQQAAAPLRAMRVRGGCEVSVSSGCRV